MLRVSRRPSASVASVALVGWLDWLALWLPAVVGSLAESVALALSVAGAVSLALTVVTVVGLVALALALAEASPLSPQAGTRRTRGARSRRRR